jgi:hypothetical protein
MVIKMLTKKGLSTIGGYESAWLADLVAAYVLKNTAHLFADAIYDGIYRDDGLVVFKGNWSRSKITDWLELECGAFSRCQAIC